MILELLSFALINPETDKIAYAYDLQKPVQVISQDYSEELFLPKKDDFMKFYTQNSKQMKNILTDFNMRKARTEQYLKWVDLPETQLKGHLDEIYYQATKLKSRKNLKDRPLVVLGIGGSKHTAEFLLNMAGKGNQGLVYFYSDIDPVSYNNFLKSTKSNVEDLNFLVVTKSGTTFETKDAFVRFENDLIKYYQDQGLTPKAAKAAAQRHFAICTDKEATEKNLRKQIQNNPHYIQDLYIHDGVGGRYSMFDDAGLFVLAYAGVPYEYTQRILKGAKEISYKFIDPEDLQNNTAMKNAMFNLYVRQKGYKMLYQQYFGKIFEQGGENWAKQLYLESLKDFDFTTSKAPDSMHYATEGLYAPENRSKYYVVMTVLNPNISENYKNYVSAIKDTYREQNPVVVEELEVEGDALKPEAIGKFIQTKHFETVFMGCLRRSFAKDKEVYLHYPEVGQYNVEAYKNKFKLVNKKYNVEAGK